MSERVAYLNGEWVKEDEATISIHDRGFILADAAYEVARTFRHQPFRMERHMARLYSTLRYLAIDPGMDARAVSVEDFPDTMHLRFDGSGILTTIEIWAGI